MRQGTGARALMGLACVLVITGARLPAYGEVLPPLSLPGSTPAQESLRLRITNAAGGLIEASRDGGKTWLLLGHVTQPALKVNRASYTAAGWAHDSAIAATATNALHIKIAENPETKRPMTLSIVPEGKTVGAAVRQASATMYTDLEGGGTIFGGGLGPYVNSPVFLLRDGIPTPLPPTYEPAVGDVWLIVRYDPVRLPTSATFENRAGGTIELDYGGETAVVGVVDKPVTGIGRFEGAIYAAGGRIRANHPGVIDVSTSPYGLVGGFQIIPRQHAKSPELAYVAAGHQWLVVGPRTAEEPDWAGQPPFFSDTILPSYRPDDLFGEHPDRMQRLLSRAVVQVRCNGGPWEPMPRIAFVDQQCANTEVRSQRGRRGLWQIPAELNPNKPQPKDVAAIADHALDEVTHFRILFPQTNFWPTECH